MEKDIIRKVHITYKMIRGKNDNEIAETCIDLPISEQRYTQLLEGIRPENDAWRNIQESLLCLTYLQGYNKLGTWGIELEII